MNVEGSSIHYHYLTMSYMDTEEIFDDHAWVNQRKDGCVNKDKE